jgi:hypothetical protein
MKIDGKPFLVVIMTLVLIPGACATTVSTGGGASISGSGSAQGNSVTIPVTNGIQTTGFSVASGAMKDIETHWLKDSTGKYAEVDVNVPSATSLTYKYSLSPSNSYDQKTIPTAQSSIAAQEWLTATAATTIQANANAQNHEGDKANVGINMGPGSLAGYHNTATATIGSVTAQQSATSAIGTGSTTFTGNSNNAANDYATTNMATYIGTVTAPSTIAFASKTSDYVQTAATSGTANSITINGNAKDTSGSYSVNTPLKGTFSGLSETASAGTTTKVVQKEHVHGTFTSTATYKPTTGTTKTTTRTSNYGTDYDLNMNAAKGSSPTGNLGYYVKPGTTASTIQGAVNAAQSKDTINVAAGTYKENVVIDKSLTINGAGRFDTIVDGNKLGSVFKIGTANTNIDVVLYDLGITGGGGYGVAGGGIYNKGRATVKNCFIFANSALGGGIENEGMATVSNSIISGNLASLAGGGICNFGTATVTSSTISGNSAVGLGSGGGICNALTEAKLTVSGSTISGNSAANLGGGIYNEGSATVTSSTISGNSAEFDGGGIYNSGTAIIKKGNYIFSNIADSDAHGYGRGGGIFKYGGGTLIFKDQSGNIITAPNVVNSIVFSNYLQNIGGTLSNIAY